MLSNVLPQTSNGSILVTFRSQDVALRLTGSHHDVIKVNAMDEDPALLLFRKPFRAGLNKGDALELLRALDFMPLAIT